MLRAPLEMLRTVVGGLAVALLATPLVAPHAASAADGRWMPVEVGTKKTFVHRQDRELESEGASLGDERMVGTREEWVIAPPSSMPEVTAEVRVTTTLAGTEGEQTETQRVFVSPTPSAYQIHAAEFEANGQRYAIRYPRPAVALAENVGPGERWHVSSEDVGGLTGETWGEVVGIQDARTPAGLFEGCLVVRYTVELSGTLEVPGAGTMDVSDGRMVVTEWHAKDVGLVLAKEELSETLVAANGTEVVARMTSQSALKQLEGAASPAAPEDAMLDASNAMESLPLE